RLALGDLPRDVKVVASSTLVCCTGIGAAIVAVGVGWAPFSSEYVLSRDPQPPLPRLGIVACFLGLACGCATSAWATRHSGRLQARPLLLLSGGIGAGVAAPKVI